jgi:hypothetical protein
MSKKTHGTSDVPVQTNLRWNVDRSKADRICNYNRHYAENGSQIGNSVQPGVQIPLFKFQSFMSGAIQFRSGGPILWKGERQQDSTALSSCDAEIRATNTGSRMTSNLRNMISHLSSLGYPIDNANVLPQSTMITRPVSSGVTR